MFKLNFFNLVFIGIILLASFLRLSNLDTFPVGFHIDEASLGYNGYSLLLTGKDDNGNKLPLYIDIFGDQRPSGYHYLTIIPIKLFGLTEFATRLPGAMFGIFSIIAIFIFTNSMFQNKKLALLSSFLLAISPWHIVLSRASAETIVALFFILIGFSLILISLRNKKSLFLLIGTLFLIVSFFFYHTPRVFVPLLFVSFGLATYSLYKNNKKYLKKFLMSIIIVGFVSLFLIFSVSGGTGRFTQVNIFGHPETRLIMEEQIREDGVSKISVFATRFSHNKIVNYSKTFISNYLDYFSGKFLFIDGGLPIWYKVPGMGLLYIIELPFILLGLFYLFVNKNVIYRLIPLWILVAPITASLTVDDIPNIQRAIVLFPMLEIVTAYGLYTFYNKYAKFQKYLTVLLIILFSFNFYFFFHQYFVHSKVHKPWFRNNGFDTMIKAVAKSYDSYDSVIITKAMGGIYPLILFHSKYDPAVYQKEGSPKDKEYSGFGKFFFVPQECPSLQKDDRFPQARRILYVDKGECSTGGVLIYREDGTKAFRIVYD